MARAKFVKKARKDIWSEGKTVKRKNRKGDMVERSDKSQPSGKDDRLLVKKGESYYWWKFRYGGKHISKTAPKQSQLTQSDFLSQVYGIEERIADLSGDEAEDIKSEVESIVEDLRSLAEECEEKRSNMPDQLQDSGSGEMLQTRVDECNSMADELESVDLDFEREDPEELTKEEGETDADFDTRKEEAQEEVDSDYQQKIEDAISELQGVSYNGE